MLVAVVQSAACTVVHDYPQWPCLSIFSALFQVSRVWLWGRVVDRQDGGWGGFIEVVNAVEKFDLLVR